MNKQLKADMMLVLVTLFWGVSYLLMDIALEDLGPFTLNFIRFFGAFVIVAAAFFPKIMAVNKITLAYSALIGLILVFVYIGATVGVMYTSLSNAGFLCALTCVFTPVLGFIFKKQKPDRKFIFVIVICFAGIALLSLDENLKPAPGDIICMLCAVAYAADLLLTETAVSREEVNVFQLGVFQMGFTGAFCFIAAAVFETPHLPHGPKVWGAVLFLAVFCTGIALIVQTVAQQYTSASRVGIIFTLEPVFAAITAYFIAGERLIPRAYAGAVLLLLSLLIMETDLNKITRKLFRKQKIDK